MTLTLPHPTASIPQVQTALAPRAGAPRTRPRPPWRTLALLTLFGTACAVALWVRLPEIARATFWAEDGRNFVSNAATHGWGDLFRPYAGYLHTVPRLGAMAVVTLPVSDWALATTAFSCAVAGVLAVVVFCCTRDVVPWMPARILIAALTVLAPLGPREVLGDLANLHSVFLWALFWMLLHRPHTRTGAAVLSVVALLGALTEIQALALLPLLFLRPHDRKRWLVRGGMLVGLAAQVFVAIGWPRPHPTHALIGVPSLVYGYLINVATPLAVPQRYIGHVLVATGPLVGILVLAGVLAAAVYVVLRGGWMQRVTAVAAVGLSMALYVIDIEMNPASLYDYAHLSRTGLEHAWLVRYGVVPSILLASMVPLAAAVAVLRRRAARAAAVAAVGAGGAADATGAASPRVRNTAVRVLVAATAVLTVLVLVQFPPQDTRRWHGPEWQPQVAAAADQCVDNPHLRIVRLNETLGWKVSVPCTSFD